MIDTQLIAFAGVSILLSVTPGPDMAVVTKNALAHGRRGVLLTTSGIALALITWVTATAVGLSALLRTSGDVLFALKLVGACYLGYLGIRALLESRHPAGDLLAEAPPAAPAHAVFRLVREGIRCGKPGCRCARGSKHGPYWYLRYQCWDAAAERDRYAREYVPVSELPRVRRWMQRVTGIVLLGFGARLALERV